VTGPGPGKGADMDRGPSTSHPPGPLEPEKRGESSDPSKPQPEAAEVESARVLANESREELRAAGLTDQQIRTLADEFIALDRGEGLREFIDWAKGRGGTSKAS
jgi:hypothetical protein